MPFDNLSDQPEHAWISEAFAEAVVANITAAGEEVVSLELRNRRLGQMGQNPSPHLPRTTLIELGQSLQATRAVQGSFRVEEGRITVTARVLDIHSAALVGVVEDRGELAQLLHVQNQLSKNILRLQGDRVPDSLEVSAARRRAIPLDAYRRYIKALSTEGDEQQALLEDSLARHPFYSEAKLLLGESFRRSGRARESIEVLSSIRPEDPVYRRAYFQVGLAFLAMSEPAGATEIFSNLAEREGSPVFYNNLGVARLRAGHLEDAGRVLRQAFEEDAGIEAPDEGLRADVAFNLGWCAFKEDRYAEAREWLRRAIELRPEDAQAHLLVALAAQAEGLEGESAEARVRALELDPALADLSVQALPALERIADRLPSHIPILVQDGARGSLAERVSHHMEQALGHREAGRREEAIQEAQRAVYLSPYSAGARLMLARLYRDAGALEKATDEVRVVLWSAESGPAHLLLAQILVARGELGEARSHAERAIALNPDDAAAREILDQIRAKP
jgi:tetratricopeptide (TPR) repeat protein